MKKSMPSEDKHNLKKKIDVKIIKIHPIVNQHPNHDNGINLSSKTTSGIMKIYNK